MDSSLIVAVRLRPFTKNEASDGSVCLASMPKPGIVHIYEPGLKNKNVREYKYDHTFWSLDTEKSSIPYASQETVYTTIGYPLLLKTLDGFNTCIFAYGMTSSGKTYSITGPPNDPGIIPRIIKDLFENIEKRTIYNERIRDLLCLNPSGNGLVVREHPVTGPYIDGLLCKDVFCESDVTNWLDFGGRVRTVAATPLNENSSRSHTVLVLSVTRRSTTKYSLGDVDNVYNSRITIVDLAGSERQTSSSTVGGRFIESCQINKSLFTLGKVITQLSQNAANNKRPMTIIEQRSAVRNVPPVTSVTPCRLINKRKDFVSYRDSLLTWLLKDSLGGNAITVMLATISPCISHYDETLSTLRYAKKASSIVNSAVVNEDPKSRLIRELMSEIRALREKVSSVSYESGTSQAYEMAKLKELISLREDDVHQLRRRLTDRHFPHRSKSTEAATITTERCKSTQTSEELYSVEPDPLFQVSRNSLFNENRRSVIKTPLRQKNENNVSDSQDSQPPLPSTCDVPTSIGHSLLCSPEKHCELIEQIKNLKCSLKSAQDKLMRESLSAKSANCKVEELSQKVCRLEENLASQTCLLQNFRQAFDSLNRNYQSVLQSLPHLLKKVARVAEPNCVLGDITSQLNQCLDLRPGCIPVDGSSANLQRHTVLSCIPEKPRKNEDESQFPR
uniref:Kinesin-like protein n=1 Tax=Trichobilharzia regenti TaxID=157069 RepID=A0AA85JU88_TRIRE|nr:unnamed protein product [Trichobilharzia regenti]